MCNEQLRLWLLLWQLIINKSSVIIVTIPVYLNNDHTLNHISFLCIIVYVRMYDV